MLPSTNDDLEALRRTVARRHHLLGWCALLLFLSLGAFLEFLHGFKFGFYLDPGHRLRRELWTLAHAHGTLLALVQIGFAAGLTRFGGWTAGRLKLASFFLLDATLLIPLGFFLGGLAPSEGDPWVGILLVPPGALLLFIAVGLIIASARGEPLTSTDKGAREVKGGQPGPDQAPRQTGHATDNSRAPDQPPSGPGGSRAVSSQ
jgi:hypothetical protein